MVRDSDGDFSGGPGRFGARVFGVCDSLVYFGRHEYLEDGACRLWSLLGGLSELLGIGRTFQLERKALFERTSLCCRRSWLGASSISLVMGRRPGTELNARVVDVRCRSSGQAGADYVMLFATPPTV